MVALLYFSGYSHPASRLRKLSPAGENSYQSSPESQIAECLERLIPSWYFAQVQTGAYSSRMTHFPETTVRARNHIKLGCRQQGVLAFPFTPEKAREIVLINQGVVTSEPRVNAPQGVMQILTKAFQERRLLRLRTVRNGLNVSLKTVRTLCTNLSLEDGT